jgi:hypothetical protein
MRAQSIEYKPKESIMDRVRHWSNRAQRESQGPLVHDSLKTPLLLKENDRNKQQGNLPPNSGGAPILQGASLKELQKTTFPLMAAVAISNIMYSSLHSFYPIYIQSTFP